MRYIYLPFNSTSLILFNCKNHMLYDSLLLAKSSPQEYWGEQERFKIPV